MIMYPMTLWETKESNGCISLMDMFNKADYQTDGMINDLDLETLFYVVCRGGWPRFLALKTKEAQLEIAKDFFSEIHKKDISSIDGVNRDAEVARTLLWSYARNMAKLTKKKNIYKDVIANHNISEATLASYIEALEKLFVIKDIDAWTLQIRSKTAIRSSKKHIFIDPSIGLAALNIGPEYFYNDLDTFGHVFENLVLRDLLVYAEAHDARVMHYSDDMGLKIDAIFQLNDGRYALIEIKTGESAIPAAEKNLLKFKELIKKHNDKVLSDKEHPGVKYREPSLMMVICAKAAMSFTTNNGVKVIPIGCLKD